MTKHPLTNVAASVRSRLLTPSRVSREDFSFLLRRCTAERFSASAGPRIVIITASSAPRCWHREADPIADATSASQAAKQQCGRHGRRSFDMAAQSQSRTVALPSIRHRFPNASATTPGSRAFMCASRRRWAAPPIRNAAHYAAAVSSSSSSSSRSSRRWLTSRVRMVNSETLKSAATS